MAISALLQTIYASAPTDVAIIATLEVRVAGQTPIYLAHAYEDLVLGVPGVGNVAFEACSLEIALPNKDTTGNQSLNFGIGLVDSRAFNLVRIAQESGLPALLVYREYLSTDATQPARVPTVMTIAGGEFNGPTLQIEASYFDVLNFAWPRQRYTVENAPGVKYMT